MNNERRVGQISLDSGSESAESLFAEHQYVRYDGSLDDGRLSQWLSESPKLLKMLSAPLLVCTIDHLMTALKEHVEANRCPHAAIADLRFST